MNVTDSYLTAQKKVNSLLKCDYLSNACLFNGHLFNRDVIKAKLQQSCETSPSKQGRRVKMSDEILISVIFCLAIYGNYYSMLYLSLFHFHFMFRSHLICTRFCCSKYISNIQKHRTF